MKTNNYFELNDEKDMLDTGLSSPRRYLMWAPKGKINVTMEENIKVKKNEFQGWEEMWEKLEIGKGNKWK